MKAHDHAGIRPAATHGRIILFGCLKPRWFRHPTPTLGQLAPLAVLILAPLLACGQSYSLDAVSREISVFMDNPPGPSLEAISREVSVFNAGTYSLDAVSREVSVINYGFNHLNVAVGSTVVLAGTAGGVPMTFSTLAPVTNVQIEVDFPQNLLTSWSVQPQSPLAGSAMVLNSSRLFLTFTPPDGQTISNTQPLGQINFTSASSQRSAFLPLQVASAAAPMQDGAVYTPYETAQNGEVVVLNTNSLLRASRGTNGQEYLTLYGYSGINYTIESTTNLSPPVTWQPAFTLTPEDLFVLSPGLATTNRETFYRARQ
jgi:hypothetical protein